MDYKWEEAALYTMTRCKITKWFIVDGCCSKVASCGEGGSSEGFCGHSSSEFEWGILHVTMCAAIHASGTIEYHSHFKHTGISKWTKHGRLQCFQGWPVWFNTFTGEKKNSHLVQPCSLQKSMTSNIRIILTNFWCFFCRQSAWQERCV